MDSNSSGEKTTFLDFLARALWPAAVLAMFLALYPQLKDILNAVPEMFGRASRVSVSGVELEISPGLARRLTRIEQEAIPQLNRASILLLLHSEPSLTMKTSYWAGSEQGEGIHAYDILASVGLMTKTDLPSSECGEDFRKQAGEKARCFEARLTASGGRFREFLYDLIAEKLKLTD